MDNTDPNQRPLSREESVALLSRPLVGVFSSVNPGGWIHSVPVHFLYSDDQVKFLAGMRDVKTRNIERTGHGTLCVETTEGRTRSYVSVSGAATVRRPPEPDELRALDKHYARDDFAAGWDDESFAFAVMVVVSIERWIAWVDWD